MKHICMAIGVAVLAVVASAEPSISVSQVRQRYPWNGTLDIGYTVAGIAQAGKDAANFKVSLAFSSVSNAIQLVCTNLTWDSATPAADGAHRVVWDAVADGLGAFVPDGQLTATLVELGDPTPDEAEFMIIDISGGCTGSTMCPVTYVRATTAAAESEKYNTDAYKVGKIVLRKVHAKGQTFRMGVGSTGDVSTGSNWHEVGFTKDFFLGIFEFTFGQFKTVVGNGTRMGNQVGETQYTYGGNMQGDGYNMTPAYKLSYNQYFSSIEVSADSPGSTILHGTVYSGGVVGLLNAHLDGVTSPSLLSLPTEAQWEYVARAGSQTSYPYGNNAASHLRPYAWNSANSSTNNYKNTTGCCMHVVGTREHDPWGFYDMLGNAAEWVEDWYDSAGYALGAGYVAGGVTWDPTGPADDAGFTKRVARGGYFSRPDSETHPGHRGNNNVNVAPTSVGGKYVSIRLKAEVESREPAPAVAVASNVVAGVKIEPRATDGAVLVPAHVSEILPIAWNSAADWRAGGDSEAEATVTVTAMSGAADGDPSSWTAGAVQTLTNATGEGVCNWTPTTHDLRRVRLAVGGDVMNVYYNLTATAGIVEATNISTCTITLASATVEWTGQPAPPAVTVTDGGTTLTLGTDYVVSSEDVAVGPATVTISGVGRYQGSVTRSFEIVAPTAAIELTGVHQRYPWNGLVDIDYTVSGTQMDPAGFDLALTLTVDDGEGEPDEIALRHFTTCAGCDLPTTPGTHRVTWDSAADGVKVCATNAVFTARIAASTLTAATADFMIIDLSGGSSAATYPVRYAAGGDTSVFNVDAYKLDKLVLRRLSAGDHWIGTGGTGDLTNSKYQKIPSNRVRVRLTKDYYLGVFEVTQRQYIDVVGSNPSRIVAGYQTGVLDDFRRPVERTAYNTVVAANTGFLALLSAKAKRGGAAVGTYLLPTEAQWEVAARTDILTEFWWGDSANFVALMKEHMWNANNSYLDEAPTKKGTHPVGLKPENPWGFYDILGNVAELCRDYYVTPYSLTGGDGVTRAGNESDPVVDPLYAETTSTVVVRGGSWNSGGDFYDNYAGCRRTQGPTASEYTAGFRVSFTLP